MLEQQHAGRGRAFLVDAAGLGEDPANLLTQYAVTAMEQARQRSAELIRGLCNQRASLSSRSDLAQAVVSMDEQFRVMREAISFNLYAVLDANDQRRFESWLETSRHSMTKVAFDYAAYLNSPDVDIDATLDRVCARYADE